MDCVPIFLEGLRNHDPEVRSAAALALGRTPSSDPAILPALVLPSRTRSRPCGNSPCMRLGMRGTSSMPDLSALRSPSTSPAWTMRHAVALSLGKLGDPRTSRSCSSLSRTGRPGSAARRPGRSAGRGTRERVRSGHSPAPVGWRRGGPLLGGLLSGAAAPPRQPRQCPARPGPGRAPHRQRALTRAGALVLSSNICRR